METTFLDKKDYIKLYKDQAGVDRKNHWKKFLTLMATIFLAVFIISFINNLLLGDSFIANLFLQLMSFLTTIFSIKYILNLLDNKTLNYKEIIKSFTLKQLFYGILAYIMMIVLIYLGLILLIVPGIIISFMFIMVNPIVAEKEINPITALKESHRLTDNYKIKIFKTVFSVGIYYMLIPLLIIFLAIIGILFGLPLWVFLILGIPYILSIFWANFALITLVPRIYRDLEMIKPLQQEEIFETEIEKE